MERQTFPSYLNGKRSSVSYRKKKITVIKKGKYIKLTMPNKIIWSRPHFGFTLRNSSSGLHFSHFWLRNAETGKKSPCILYSPLIKLFEMQSQLSLHSDASPQCTLKLPAFGPRLCHYLEPYNSSPSWCKMVTANSHFITNP